MFSSTSAFALTEESWHEMSPEIPAPPILEEINDTGEVVDTSLSSSCGEGSDSSYGELLEDKVRKLDNPRSIPSDPPNLPLDPWKVYPFVLSAKSINRMLSSFMKTV